MNHANWELAYHDISKAAKSYGEEALLALGNGYLGWRGAPVWSTFSDNHYPALYVAGVFNQTQTPVADRMVVNEDLVNLPNPQLTQIWINGQLLSENNLETRASHLRFDRGELTETFTFGLAEGTVTLTTTKMVDPIAWHHMGMQLELSTDFEAQLKLASIIDASVTNQNVVRYRDFDATEFNVKKIDSAKHQVYVQTRQSGIDIAIGATTKVWQQDQVVIGTTKATADQLIESYTTTLLPNVPVILNKTISVATSQETSTPLDEALAALMTEVNLNFVRNHSLEYWRDVWHDADIEVESDDKRLQQLIRLNIFHLHQAAQSNANPHLDASVGSRGLTGEGYRGHIFWDELFLVPYYAANDPKAARALIQYRIQRLAGAQANAQRESEAGAMYPWQSGLYGDEQAQVIHLNTVDQSWIPDNSRLQRHVSLAIAYDLWVYTRITKDVSLLQNGGLTMLLEIAKFWLHKVQLADDGRFDLADVMGPDEFHEAYPDAKTAGIKNNAYTNVMLTWLLNWILELQTDFSAFDAIAASDNFDATLLERAKAVAHGLRLERNEAGVFAQYEGYFALKELDFAAYAEKYGDIHRIDRLLKAEGKSPDDYQVAKQADLLMLLYNFDDGLVAKLLEQLGYPLKSDWLAVNKNYYLERTVHGSTTSRPVFAGIDVTLGQLDEAEQLLAHAIRSDVDDIQGGTTAEGIHTGVMGETLAVVQNKFAGVHLLAGMPEIKPNLPETWASIHFKQQYQGIWLDIVETHTYISLTADATIQVKINDEEYLVTNGEPLVVTLGVE
ncbi:glycoside hydrolase family 65 protein [Weissella viridescens]|uniref:Glycoside hydrolase family 65 protein n=1 Tax=Weissella viridescens TaxID=1629 RepID=A0A3P2RM47_WEIVI|nr:glycosyl hydrolase family 65 protein [Weissella viridescens]RRG18762.1 glycoside hydrolase family 65 protein [Weissella viridescens]